MPRVCIEATGICTAQCKLRETCTIRRRSILQYFVATHRGRGVYADSILSDVAKQRASALTDVPDANDNMGVCSKTTAVRIRKGAL